VSEALFHPPGQQIVQDWPALEAHLAAHEMTLDLSLPPRQFAGGFGNLNYLLRIAGCDCVLRRPPPGDQVPGGNDMTREFGITSKLWRGFPLAPRAIHCCTDEAVLGAPFLIMEYRSGLIIGGQLPAERPFSLEHFHVDWK
jgi:aminoglycoside phosphotransferase (APT) family kinase protein